MSSGTLQAVSKSPFLISWLALNLSFESSTNKSFNATFIFFYTICVLYSFYRSWLAAPLFVNTSTGYSLHVILQSFSSSQLWPNFYCKFFAIYFQFIFVSILMLSFLKIAQPYLEPVKYKLGQQECSIPKNHIMLLVDMFISLFNV